MPTVKTSKQDGHQIARRLKKIVRGNLKAGPWMSSYGRFQFGSLRIVAMENAKKLSRSYRVIDSGERLVFEGYILGLFGLKYEGSVFVPGEWCDELFREHVLVDLGLPAGAEIRDDNQGSA